MSRLSALPGSPATRTSFRSTEGRVFLQRWLTPPALGFVGVLDLPISERNSRPWDCPPPEPSGALRPAHQDDPGTGLPSAALIGCASISFHQGR